MKLERAGFRALSVSILLMTASVVQGAPLWSNGAILPQSPQACDGPCGISGGPVFTVFDNFTVGPGSPWFVTGFDYTDFFLNTTTATGAYSSTLWSIWNGDPAGGAKVIASGSAVAGLSTVSCTVGIPNACLVQYTVTGISVTLTSGTYWLGTASVDTPGSTINTQRAVAAGNGLPGYENSNAGDPNNPPPVGTMWPAGTITGFSGDSAFDINGGVLPEPGTMTLMGLALAGLWMGRRRLQRKATT